MDKYFIIYNTKYEGTYVIECDSKETCERDLGTVTQYEDNTIVSIIKGKYVEFEPVKVVTKYKVKD